MLSRRDKKDLSAWGSIWDVQCLFDIHMAEQIPEQTEPINVQYGMIDPMRSQLLRYSINERHLVLSFS